MKTRDLISITALILAICISSRQPVHAGSTTVPSGSIVRGIVKFEGTVPKAKPINMAADPSCAKQHPSPVLDQEVLSDTKGDLQNVVVFVSDGLGDRAFDPPSQPVEMKQKGCMYEPHVLALQANQPVEVTNNDPTTHNIHPQPANNREWNKAEVPGSKIEESFPRQEIAIPVKCNVHPWMRGYVAVFKHPYFAVTGKDGSFALNNLPPGTYTIQAWHEKLGTSTQKITIGANESKNIDFVFKSM
jgi:plastocyanin